MRQLGRVFFPGSRPARAGDRPQIPLRHHPAHVSDLWDLRRLQQEKPRAPATLRDQSQPGQREAVFDQFCGRLISASDKSTPARKQSWAEPLRATLITSDSFEQNAFVPVLLVAAGYATS